MHKIAWKSLNKNGGIGRASINHFTSDNKKTLCNKDIPQKVQCLDAFGSDDCAKCLERKTLVDDSNKKSSEKAVHFKNIVENLGGTYEIHDDVHSGWWDAYGDKKNLYIAYGRLTPMIADGDSLRMTDNWLYFKPNERTS